MCQNGTEKGDAWSGMFPTFSRSSLETVEPADRYVPCIHVRTQQASRRSAIPMLPNGEGSPFLWTCKQRAVRKEPKVKVRRERFGIDAAALQKPIVTMPIPESKCFPEWMGLSQLLMSVRAKLERKASSEGNLAFTARLHLGTGHGTPEGGSVSCPPMIPMYKVSHLLPLILRLRNR